MSQALEHELTHAFRVLTNPILEHPDKLTVTLTPSAQGCELAARPYSYTDKGKLIGGQAETHRAMQIVLSAVAYRRGKHCRYIILPSQSDKKDDLPPFYEAENWKPDAALGILREACALCFPPVFSVQAVDEADSKSTQLVIAANVLDNDNTALLVWALNRMMHAAGNALGRRLFVTLKITR